jgi:peptidoglycan/LPS O-acetylase OafA/YrhL
MEPRRYAYIDALRGYAILMVIAVHASQLFTSPSILFLASQGARGVQLFFVASAITLCMSWKARHDGTGPFYIRRFFRIAPMFYLAIAVFVWLKGFGPSQYAPAGIGLRHIVMAATFTHGFLPDTITSVVPGSWSIADEVIFYAIFPVLIGGLGRVRFAPAALIVAVITVMCLGATTLAVVLGKYIGDAAWQLAWTNFAFLWFPQQFPCFLFGMLAFKWVAEGGSVRWPRALVAVSVATMVLTAIFPNLPLVHGFFLPTQFGAAFALFALGISHWQPTWLVNPIIGWIGKISYSGYLIHLALVDAAVMPHTNYFETFAVLAAATIVLSTVTYLCIEEPFNRIGRKLIRWLRTDRTTKEPWSPVASRSLR